MLPQQENAVDILSERWSAIGPMVGNAFGAVLQVDPSSRLGSSDRLRIALAAAEIPNMFQVLTDLDELWNSRSDLSVDERALHDQVVNIIARIEGE